MEKERYSQTVKERNEDKESSNVNVITVVVLYYFEIYKLQFKKEKSIWQFNKGF